LPACGLDRAGQFVQSGRAAGLDRGNLEAIRP
jgi:hypothetical protein